MSESSPNRTRSKTWLIIAAAIMAAPALPLLMFAGRYIQLRTAPEGVSSDVPALVAELQISDATVILPPESTQIRWYGTPRIGCFFMGFRCSESEFHAWTKTLQVQVGRSSSGFVRVQTATGTQEETWDDAVSISLGEDEIPAGVTIENVRVLDVTTTFSPSRQRGAVEVITAGGW